MIAEAFLICAFALRPIAWPPFEEDVWYHEAAELFQKQYPDKQLWFIQKYDLPEPQFHKVPFVTYRDYVVYVERAS